MKGDAFLKCPTNVTNLAAVVLELVTSATLFCKC